jgi:hypothetical protein
VIVYFGQGFLVAEEAQIFGATFIQGSSFPLIFVLHFSCFSFALGRLFSNTHLVTLPTQVPAKLHCLNCAPKLVSRCVFAQRAKFSIPSKHASFSACITVHM